MSADSSFHPSCQFLALLCLQSNVHSSICCLHPSLLLEMPSHPFVHATYKFSSCWILEHILGLFLWPVRLRFKHIFILTTDPCVIKMECSVPLPPASLSLMGLVYIRRRQQILCTHLLQTLKIISTGICLHHNFSLNLLSSPPPLLSSSPPLQAQWGWEPRGGRVRPDRRGDGRIVPQLAAFPHRDQPLRAVRPTQSRAGRPAQGPGHTEDHQCGWVRESGRGLCCHGVCVECRWW